MGCTKRKKASAKIEKLGADQNDIRENGHQNRPLKFYAFRGIKNDWIHRIVKFKQRRLFGEYIQNKSNKRAKNMIEAEKLQWNRMKSIKFGWLRMSVAKLSQAKRLNDRETIMKFVSEPTCKKVTRYDSYAVVEYQRE